MKEFHIREFENAVLRVTMKINRKKMTESCHYLEERAFQEET